MIWRTWLVMGREAMARDRVFGWVKTKRLARDLAFCLLLVAGVVFLLWRTDRERLVEIAIEPYAAMEIIPESLEHAPIADSNGEWGLFFGARVLKNQSCEEIIVERFVHRMGEAAALATNRDISAETVKPSPDTQIVPGLHAKLTKPLEPGDYFFLLRSTCYVADEKIGKMQLGPPAEAFICFHVPEHHGHPMDRQLLQPVSENCRRELSDLVLNPSLRRFVTYEIGR